MLKGLIYVLFSVIVSSAGEYILYQDELTTIFTDSAQSGRIDKESVKQHYSLMKKILMWSGEGVRKECKKDTTSVFLRRIRFSRPVSQSCYYIQKVRASFAFSGKMIFDFDIGPYWCINEEKLRQELCTADTDTDTENETCIKEICEDRAVTIAGQFLFRLLEEYNAGHTYNDFDSIKVTRDISFSKKESFNVYIRSKQKTIAADYRSVRIYINPLTGEVNGFISHGFVSRWDLSYIPKISAKEALAIAEKRIREKGLDLQFVTMRLVQRRFREDKYWIWYLWYEGEWKEGQRSNRSYLNIDSEDGTVRFEFFR